MDQWLLIQFVHEIERQGEFAELAWEGLNQTLAQFMAIVQSGRRAVQTGQPPLPLPDSHRTQTAIFFFAHAFLSHVANISKLLQPPKASMKKRGQLLMAELQVHGDLSPQPGHPQ